jgi:hypothetical protein
MGFLAILQRHSSIEMKPMIRQRFLILLIFLLLGAGLRFQGQAEMAHLLHHDEAYYGLDALSLLESPRLQVYFPANTGREGLWMYLLTPLLGTLGATPLALRLTSAFVGIVTLTALYWLARESYKEGAIWAVGALAVFYWHMQLSHIGFRVITFPLMGAMGFAALFRAQRLNRDWWLAGLLLGLLLYTYVAAGVYVAYAALWLIFWAIRWRSKGSLLALGIIVLMAIPLAFALFTPAEGTAPISRAAASGLEEILGNLGDWARAWLEKGDRNSTHNLPLRPIFDLPLAILAILGFFGAWFAVKKRWMILWWLGLMLLSLVPTVLSTEAPHFLRGSGLILPTALLLGIGAAFISRWRYSWIIPFMLILWAGWNSYSDFQTWLRDDTTEFGISYDYRINNGMGIIATETPADSPIVLAGLPFNPNAAFLAKGLNRPISFYEWPDDSACYLSPRESYTMLDLPIVLDSFSRRVQAYGSLETIFAHPENDFNVYQVTPLPELIENWETPLLGDVLQMRVLPPTTSTTHAGETLEIFLGLRRISDFTRQDYRILAHLQGNPSPYEGGTLYSTGDTALCPLAYSATEELTLVQRLQIPIPADLPAGDYHIALGLYEPETFARLPIIPAENEHGYFTGWQFSVIEN